MSESSSPLPNNNNLLDYATYVLNGCKTPQLTVPDNYPIDNLRPTAALGNSCVAPMVLARSWALLSLIGDGKTGKELKKKTAKILGCHEDHLHEVVNPPVVKNLGAVAFFSEFPPGSPLNEERLNIINAYYGEAVKNMCFSCDHDGLRSIKAINQVMEMSTMNRVQHVVREENAPNRRSLTVLASAVDCTFFWKHSIPLEAVKVKFFDQGKETSSSYSVVNGWRTRDRFRHARNPDRLVLRLDSHVPGVQLILFMPAGNAAPTAAEVLELGRHLPEPSKEVTLFIPQFSVATPLSVRDCSIKGKYNMNRVFDREKSDLSGHLAKFHAFFPNITTLWDCYHKVVFTIVDSNEDKIGVSKERHQIGVVAQKQSYWKWSDDLPAQCFKYHEERLAKPPIPSCQKPSSNGIHAEDAGCEVSFDAPFYFLLVQDLESNPLVQCFGRFTNADAIYSGHEEGV